MSRGPSRRQDPSVPPTSPEFEPVEFNIEWVAPIATAVVVIVGAVGGHLWRMSLIHHRNEVLQKENEKLQLAVEELRGEITRLGNLREDNNRLANEKVNTTLDIRKLKDHIRSVKAQLKKTQEEKARIVAKGNQLVRAYWAMEDQNKRAKNEMKRIAGEKEAIARQAEEVRAGNEEFGGRIREMEKQLDGMKTQDGRVWQRPVASTAPSFRPAAERGFPIISVLNLKGGVGKTTITAHLGGALGRQGKRVLMADLDYQRSLSMMLIPSEQRRMLHLENRCLQHFLAGPHHGTTQLLNCVLPVAGMERASLVTNSDSRAGTEEADSLEETESRLMAEWMVNKTGRDIRLFLREALHSPEMTRKFDYVLLDCPPRLTTAAVNALAASDYVLIPVVPDALSTRALPELLRFLRRLREHLIPNLAVLGVVANLATIRKSELIAQEFKVWDEMQGGLKGVWPAPVPFFDTKIPDASVFGKAAGSIDSGELRLALDDETIASTYAQLVTEIEKEIRQHECLHASAISS